jgi:hypothetical protein
MAIYGAAAARRLGIAHVAIDAWQRKGHGWRADAPALPSPPVAR